jgi:hypothetical protein
MKNMCELTARQREILLKLPEQGLGYQVIDIFLKGGQLLEGRIIIDSSFIAIGELEHICPQDIEAIRLHERQSGIVVNLKDYSLTFEEAVQYKKSISADQLVDNGLEYMAFVTPYKDEDFYAYLSDVRLCFRHLKDDMAKWYSRHGEYAVRGLVLKGAKILYKQF